MLEGAAPKRVVISQWKSMDDAKKFYSSEVIKKSIRRSKKVHVRWTHFCRRSSTKLNEALPNDNNFLMR